MSDSFPPFIVAIPARHASTRLPGKPLRLLGGRPLIAHVVARALASGAQQVVVATDDARIAAAVEGVDPRVEVGMTGAGHASGSDRLAECARQRNWPADAVVVNLQGDEPFAPVAGIRAVAALLAAGDAPMATLCTAITDAEELFDPNVVKVVTSATGRALYFSRAPVPWARDAFAASREQLPPDLPCRRHIGIYAYRAGFLKRFATLAPTPLERAESLEQLRALEHGHAIAVCDTPEPFPPGIDTAADLERAEAWLARAPAEFSNR